MNENLLSRITLNPKVCKGKPTIRNTRFTVAQMLELMAGGMETEEILEDYPYIEKEDVLACLSYAAKVVNIDDMLNSKKHARKLRILDILIELGVKPADFFKDKYISREKISNVLIKRSSLDLDEIYYVSKKYGLNPFYLLYEKGEKFLKKDGYKYFYDSNISTNNINENHKINSTNLSKKRKSIISKVDLIQKENTLVTIGRAKIEIKEGNTRKAIDTLLSISNSLSKRKSNEIIMLSSEWEEVIHNQTLLNIEKKDESKNRINMALLKIADELTKNFED